MEDLGRRYELHHQTSRDGGDFIFVPERIPFLVAAVGGPRKRARSRLPHGRSQPALPSRERRRRPRRRPVALRRAAALGLETDVARTPRRSSRSPPRASTRSSRASCSSTCATPRRSSQRRPACCGPAECSPARRRTRTGSKSRLLFLAGPARKTIRPTCSCSRRGSERSSRAATRPGRVRRRRA